MFTPKQVKIVNLKKRKRYVELEFEDNEFWNARWDGFWQDINWKKELKKGLSLRLWCVQLSCVVGVEVWLNNDWQSAWCAANHFEDD